MLKEERFRLILRQVHLHNKVLSTDLSELLGVSNDTIRRDLKELTDLGKVIKTHGGAVSPTFINTITDNKDIYAHDQKKIIAEKANTLIKSNMTIVVEGGTTVLEFAKKISSHIKATFYTISPHTAITLAAHENLTVYTIGGKLDKNSNLHTGAEVINRLMELQADLCLTGANGFSIQKGLTDVDWEVVQVLKAMTRCAKKTGVLTISEKLNTQQKIMVCDFNKIDYLVTELDTGAEILKPYVNSHIKVL